MAAKPKATTEQAPSPATTGRIRRGWHALRFGLVAVWALLSGRPFGLTLHHRREVFRAFRRMGRHVSLGDCQRIGRRIAQLGMRKRIGWAGAEHLARFAAERLEAGATVEAMIEAELAVEAMSFADELESEGAGLREPGTLWPGEPTHERAQS